MNIAYYSAAPFTPCGYGRCTKELVYKLLDKHHIDLYTYYGVDGGNFNYTLTGSKGPKQVQVIGGNGDVVHELCLQNSGKYDIVLAHFDLWMIVSKLRNARGNWIWWSILDHEPVKIPTRQLFNLKSFFAGIPMTEWGRQRLLECNDIPEEKVGPIIPHGININKWKPVKNAHIPGVPDDAEFVISTVTSNHVMRENNPVMLEGFAQFLKETKADAYYIMFCYPVSNTGYHLIDIIHVLEQMYDIKMSNRVVFKMPGMRYSDEYLRKVYSRADVHLLTVAGSFEIPLLEAACCGTPSIGLGSGGNAAVLDYGKRGIVIDKGYGMWMPGASSKLYFPKPEDIKDALITYYEDRKLRKKHVSNMMKWIRREATWDKVGKKWLKYLDEVEPELRKVGEV